MTLPLGLPLPIASNPSRWLQLFHSGDRAILEACYRDHFANTERAVGTILGSADRETVIHELFSRLIAQPELRRSFQGGSFGAWIATIARNQAIDYRRRLGRETATAIEADATAVTENWEQAAEAHMLVERFRRDHLPPQWQGVFELRFLRQLPQREAAAQLSMHRTTLAYRELRIRHLLRRFLLEGDEP